MSDSKGKILVTGGAGYIGSHTVLELISHGYEPLIVDNFSNSFPEVIDWLSQIIGYRPKCYHVDCTDSNAFRKVFEENRTITGVIHFAAFKAVGESVQNPLKYYRNNLESLLVLLELMGEFEVKTLVFSSSCTVYGIPKNDVQVTEDTELQPAFSPYGHTKLVAEEIIRNVAQSGQIKAVLLRYFNPVGAHESSLIGELPIGKPNNLVPFITQTAIGIREYLTIFGNTYDTPDGFNIRDYIHVSDLANAHIKSFEYVSQQKDHVSTFNIGTGTGHSVIEVVHAFERANGIKLNYKIGDKRAGDVPAIFASNEKAKNELKWSPRYSLEDSMVSAWNWQKQLKKIDVKIE